MQKINARSTCVAQKRFCLSSLISLERGKTTENAGSYKGKDLSVFVALVAMTS